MIDWKLEEQKAITNKQQKDIDYQAKIEAEKQEKIQQKLQLEYNIPIFDQVVVEELDNLKAYISKYAECEVEVSEGHVYIKRYGKNGRHDAYSYQDIFCTNSAKEDIAEWTRKRLIDIAMHYTVNYK